MRLEKNTLTVLEQDSIDHILDNFDFEKVHKAMEALDWKWGYIMDTGTLQVPEVADLKKAARRMLREAVLCPEPDCTVATGGFYVQKLDGEELKLAFQLEEWCADLTTGYCPC
jgi:hypothetical protein